MQKLDNTKLSQKILSWVGKLTSFPVSKPNGFAWSSKSRDDDAGNERHTEHCCSGGYNEAFIFEQWASFGPRH